MKLRATWSTIIGGVTSAIPLLLSCCKSGACVGVCVTPVASIFGVSSAVIAASQVTNIIELILIALSAVSFTVSYYSLYKRPQLNCNTQDSCDCPPDNKNKRSAAFQKRIFWLGLMLSIGLLSYFEYSKYQSAIHPGCGETQCAGVNESPCSTPCDTAGCRENENCSAETNTETCCEKERVANSQSEITCPKCGFKKTETMPNDVCQLKYTCSNCRAELFPKDGDCCVFCTYGTHKCPSKQDTGQLFRIKGQNDQLRCKLTSAELQKRKATVIASLKKQILEKKELSNGYTFKLEGTDKVIDELAEFIKSERACCSFFTFDVSLSGDGKEAWLTLTGPKGAKEMITSELGL